MKPLILILLAVISLSTAFSSEVVVRSFTLKASFPNPGHLLNQEMPKYEGKEVRIPYMLCGFLSPEQVLEYGEEVSGKPKPAENKVHLPNGGIAEVEIIKETAYEGSIQFDVKIQITGPGADNVEATLTTYDGDGILFRCDTNPPGKPQIIALQIQKG